MNDVEIDDQRQVVGHAHPGRPARHEGVHRAQATGVDAVQRKDRHARRVGQLTRPALALGALQADPATIAAAGAAQPALMATSVAAMRVLEAEGFAITDAAFVAGHSLGEYSALCAAGAISLSDTARLLQIRGTAMQEAVPVGQGAMAAILGLAFATVDEIAREAAEDEVCQAANDNDPAQVVISGHRAASSGRPGWPRPRSFPCRTQAPVRASPKEPPARDFRPVRDCGSATGATAP